MRWNRVVKLLYYMLKLLLIKIKTLTPLFVTLFLLGLGFFFFLQNTKKMEPTILICNEDDSLLGKLLIKGVLEEKIDRAISFSEVDLETGLEKMKNGLSPCLLYVKKGTADNLYRGEKTALSLYVRRTDSDVANFFIGYLKGFLALINTSQNAGLFYMDILSESGSTWEERERVFVDLQLSYSEKALRRDEIFEGYGERKSIFSEKNILLFLAGLLVFFSAILKKKNEIFQRDRMERLILEGFSKIELEFAYFFYSILVDSCLFSIGLLLIQAWI